jgi:hypothetical protein
MMMSRRDAVASFALFAELLASGRHADAQTQTAPAAPPASPRPPVFKHDLPNVTLDDWEVTVSYVDYAPEDLVKRLRKSVEASVRKQRITLEESRHMIQRFRDGLAGYTYLSD